MSKQAAALTLTRPERGRAVLPADRAAPHPRGDGRGARAGVQGPRRPGPAAADVDDRLAPDGEICVCDLTPAFDLSGPTISHHLKTLREAGLVDAERRGTWVYYRARPGIMRQLAGLLGVA